jgi:tetratricopeptide (TPR) repeat protein
MLPRLVLVSAILVLLSGCRREHQLTTTSADAVRSYRQGVLQYEKFNYSDAKALFEQAVRADSGFAMAWTRLAIVEMAIKDEPLAREYSTRAVRSSDGAGERERLFIRMWDERLRYDAKAAAATADSLAVRYPDEKEVYLFRGNLYELGKNYDAAIKSYQRAIQADTGYALAVMSLGYAYSAIGEQEKSIAQMERYIRLAPREPDPLASYADILLRAGKFEEALEQYGKSLALKPDYWYSIRQIGNIYAIKGRLKDAQERFEASFKLLPENRQLEATRYQAEAVLEMQRGRYAEAVTLYQKALDIDTISVEAEYGLAAALSKLEKHAEAHAVVERVLAEFRRRELHQSPAMAGYFYIRSVVLMEEGNLAGALALCDSAFNYTVPLSRGAIFRQMGEIELREKSFEQALWACEEGLAVNPNSPDILLTLTRVYSAKGDRKMTSEIGGRLLALWNNADPDFLHRREVLALVGRTAAARL